MIKNGIEKAPRKVRVGAEAGPGAGGVIQIYSSASPESKKIFKAPARVVVILCTSVLQ